MTEKYTSLAPLQDDVEGVGPEAELVCYLSASLFCLNALNYRWLDFPKDSVAADYAFNFAASQFQLLDGGLCATSNALINNACRSFLHIGSSLSTRETCFAFKHFQISTTFGFMRREI